MFGFWYAFYNAFVAFMDASHNSASKNDWNDGLSVFEDDDIFRGEVKESVHVFQNSLTALEQAPSRRANLIGYMLIVLA